MAKVGLWEPGYGVVVCLLVLCLGSRHMFVEAQNCSNSPAAIAAFLNGIEREVKVLARRAQENEVNQCSLLVACNASLSIFECSNVTAANLICTDTVKLTTRNSYCSNLTCSNQLFGYDKPATKLHPGISVYPTSGQVFTTASTVNYDRLYERAICKLNFTDLFTTMVNPLNINESAPFANWRYVGNTLGVASTFPRQVGPQKVKPDGTVACAVPYDCRLRPWYVGAVSPRKVLLILIDVGSSMGFSVNKDIGDPALRIDVARVAASQLLYSLKAGDAVAVITFSTENDVQILPSSQASVDPTSYQPLNIEEVDPAVRTEAAILNASIFNTTVRSVPSSGPGLQAAFSQALTLLGRKLRGCHKTLVVLTYPHDLGATNSTPYAVQIAAAVAAQGQPITPFFFSINANEDDGDNLLKDLACDVNGTWGRISGLENPLYDMRTFFNFLARTSAYINGTYYSGIYNDANGLGRVFTFSRPVLHPTTGDLVGVAGADASVSATRAYCPSALIEYLVNMTNVQERCLNITTFDNCLMPAVRRANHICPNTPSYCTLPEEPSCSDLSNIVPNSALLAPLVASPNISANRCCKTCSLGAMS